MIKSVFIQRLLTERKSLKGVLGCEAIARSVLQLRKAVSVALFMLLEPHSSPAAKFHSLQVETSSDNKDEDDLKAKADAAAKEVADLVKKLGKARITQSKDEMRVFQWIIDLEEIRQLPTTTRESLGVQLRIPRLAIDQE